MLFGMANDADVGSPSGSSPRLICGGLHCNRHCKKVAPILQCE
jgi:hypothetical protein